MANTAPEDVIKERAGILEAFDRGEVGQHEAAMALLRTGLSTHTTAVVIRVTREKIDAAKKEGQ